MTVYGWVAVGRAQKDMVIMIELLLLFESFQLLVLMEVVMVGEIL